MIIQRRPPTWPEIDEAPSHPCSQVEGGTCRSPDGIRTRATALRGRRARPLHNGALSTFDLSTFDLSTFDLSTFDLSGLNPIRAADQVQPLGY